MDGGESAGCHCANDKASSQPRTTGDRDRIEISQGRFGISQRGFDNRIERLKMRASSDFGDDAAKGGVILQLAEDDIRQDFA